MKKVLRYLVLGFAVSSLNILVSIAQPTFDFVRSIGGPNNEYGSSIAVLDSNAGSNVNLIYTTGVIHGTAINFNPAGTAKPLSSATSPNGDIFIAKYGSTGYLTAGGINAAFRVGSAADNDVSTKIYVDASKNIYVTGTCTANSFFGKDNVSGKLVGSQGTAFIVKYDKDYAIQWGINFGPTLVTDGAQVRGISVDASGNVYVTGVFQGTGINFNPGSTIGSASDPAPGAAINLSSNGSYDAFVAKYSSGGKCLWALSAGGTSSDEGYGIGNDASGNVYVTGIFRGQNIDFDPSASTANLSETGGGTSSGDIFVAKYSSAGAYVNAFNMGNALDEGATAIAVDASGDFAVSGYFRKDALNIDFDPDPTGTANAMAVGASGTDLFIAKYSSALAYQWHKTVGSSGNEKATHIKLAGSNLFVTGSFENTPGDFGNSNVLTSAGGTDAFMAGYTFSTGNCLFASSIGGSGNEEGSGIDYVNNKLYVTGYNNGNGDYDPGSGTSTAFTANGGQDFFFAQYTYASCTLPSISAQPSDITKCTGTSANFSVTASAATSYQWKKAGSAISGATSSSYNIASVVAADAAAYTVDVTNSCGTVTSAAGTLTVNAAVSITTPPSDLTRCTGTSASFSVSATGFGTLTYQWKKAGSAISGATSSSYNIASVVAADAAAYTVDVTNSCGTVTSAAGTLTVNAAVSITTPPSDLTRCTGTSASFSVSATGFGTLTYQWKKAGSAISGATSSSYNIASVVAGDAAAYTVDVTNSCGTVTSAAGTLTVNAAVSITTPPSDLTRCTGTSASFSVSATGFGTLTYQWKKAGSAISGATSSSYNIASVVAGDAAAYTVDVTNSCGTVTSAAGTLTVNAAVSITTPPSDLTRCTGTSASFSVSATGFGTLTYQWKKAGSAISGATSSSYNIASIVAGDAAAYTVDVTNSCGTVTSAAGTLTVNAAVSITTPPSDLTRCTGTSASFSVSATGFGTLTYQWKKAGSAISGATSSSYNIASVVAGDAAGYTVDVTNSCGTVTSAAGTLTVNAAVSITTPPSDLTRCIGTSASFSVSATGFGTLTYQWKKAGSAISGATSSSYNIASVVAADAAAYTVDVTNSCGTVTSAAGTLTVNAAVSITTPPSDLTRCTGTSANFSVSATGFGTLTYQWKKAGSAISGATSSSYNIASVVAGDAAAYTVDVTNSCGTVTSAAGTLTVNAAVSITTPPSDLTRCTGTSASFSVSATGFGTLTYQWKKAGSAISGATSSSYNIASVVAGDAAAYTVDVTNSCGTVTSAAGTLTVNAAVSITTPPSDLTRCTGTSASFSVSATGFGTLTYQWKKAGSAISGATSSSYNIASVVAGDAAAYTVDVTNSCGTVTSAAGTLTVNAAVSITTPPSDLTRCTGTSANFSVSATGFGTLTYQWKKAGSAISGATSSSYNIASVVVGDAAAYTVDVTNSCGTVTSAAGTLTVVSPILITTQPSSINRCIGTFASFSVIASNGPFTYQWRKEGSNIIGAISSSYNISSVVAGDAGNYTVDVTNACGTVTSSPAAVLSVATDLVITSQPSSVSVCSGSPASFTVSATSSGSLSYQWKKGGSIISGAQSSSYNINPVAIADGGNYTVDVTSTGCGTITSNIAVLALNDAVITTQPAPFTTLCTGNTFNLSITVSGAAPFNYQWKKGASNANGTSTNINYSIASIVFGDAGSYTVEVTNACSVVPVTSNTVTLTVQNLLINTQPISQTVCPGADVTFTVAASGPSISYQWKKDNVNLLAQTSSSLNLNGVSAADAASYTVLVSGCSNSILSDAAVLALSVCTGIEDETSLNGFGLYPNPAMTSVHLSGFANDPIQSIMIVDVNGGVVYQEKDMRASSYDVSVANFAQGLYHVILFTASGNKWVEKIEIAK